MPDWTATARYRPDHPLEIEVDALPIERALAEKPPCPVDYLLVAIASCYALSLVGALNRARRPIPPIQVTASGWRQVRPVASVGRVVLDIVCAGLGTDADRDTILADAKRICTVSNTLAGAPVIEISLIDEGQA
jgi:uncharacterized OsmC-like protein